MLSLFCRSGRRESGTRVNHLQTRLHFEPLEHRRLLAANNVLLDAPVDDAGAAATSNVKRYAILGDDSQAEAALAEMDIKKIKSFRHFSGLAVHLSDAEADSLRATFGNDFRVIQDEPFQAFDDAEVSNGKPDNPNVAAGGPGGGGQQVSWGFTAINAAAAHAVTKGAGVVVCVVDTGFDMDHPDLAANIGGGANYIDGGSPEDDNGHGTHVGGIIAALDNSSGVLGVAPEATLLAAKAFDRRGIGTHGDVADAILGCLDLKAQYETSSGSTNMPMVVNMSFTTRDYEGADLIVRPAMLEVLNTGAIFVAAAGNGGCGGGCYTGILWRPGAWPEVETITGIQEDLSFWPDSRFGRGWIDGIPFAMPYKNPEFTAPAAEIISLYKKDGTKTLTGTSMSAGFASGVFALGLSVNSPGAVGVDIGLPIEKGAGGLIDAHLTVLNASNQVPLAVDDAASTTSTVPVTTNVLANDTLGNQPTAITAVTNGASGTVTFNAAAGTTTYTPNPVFTGIDQYTYTITDNDGEASTATVTVTVSTTPTTVTYFQDEDPNLLIPDRGVVSSTLTVADSFTIADLTVTVDITHSRSSDVTVYLIHGGTTVELPSISGGNISAFNGTDVSGVWTLEVHDNKQRRTGTLNEWQITVQSAPSASSSASAQTAPDPILIDTALAQDDEEDTLLNPDPDRDLLEAVATGV